MQLNDYRVLYYPDYDPEPEWLRSQLLLVDQVIRIVPESAEHVDPDYIKELKAYLPGCITELSPESRHTQFTKEQLEILDKLFSQFKPTDFKAATVGMMVHTDGTVEFPGIAGLHESKMSAEIRELLLQHKLVLPGTGDKLGRRGHHLTDQRATSLILSGIADRLAIEQGLDTITSDETSALLNSLAALGVTRANEGKAEGELMAAIVTMNVPMKAGKLDIKKYLDIRKSFDEIRPAFRLLVRELTIDHRLDRTEDINVRAERIQELAASLYKEVRKQSETKVSQTIAKWAPLTAGGLITVATGFVNPGVAAGLAALGVGFQVFEKVNQKPESNVDKCCRMLSDLRQTIFESDLPRQLLS